MKRYLIFTTLIILTIRLQAQSHYPGQHTGKLRMEDHHGVSLQNFDLSEVKLLESPFMKSMEHESDWILSFPVERLLHSFRTNAGVYSGYEGGHYAIEPLGGWESLDCELRGHSVSHMISGLALLYATTGDEVYKIKSDSIVEGLAEVQKTLGNSGYLSAYPENLINRNIRGERVWAPWYTLHKLFSGLIDQYLYCDNQQALDIATGMSAWAYNKLEPLSEEQRKLMLRNEFGGINDSFYTLYAITSNEKDKWLAKFFYHNDVLDPLLEGEDILNKKHANTYIPKLIGLVRAYELGDSDEYLKTADFFWNTVVDHHSFVTGSNSDREKFFKPDHQSEHLTGYTGESCNVYNLLKLTKHLYSNKATVKYADFYEKALYNHIQGQQDPESGMIAYFLPMLPGAHKVYSTHDQSFWCCVGTGFENHAKYNEFIYNHTSNDLIVNLFIPSELDWNEKGIKLTQISNIPLSGEVDLTITCEKPQDFNLKIRYPSWATSALVEVNGKKLKHKNKTGTFISMDRKWSDQDEVKIVFGMELNYTATPDNENIIAFTYGPVVLAGKMGTENISAPAPFSDPIVRNDYYTYDYKVPKSITNNLSIDLSKLNMEIERIENDGLEFRIKKNGILLEPIANIHRERYIIYWNAKNTSK